MNQSRDVRIAETAIQHHLTLVTDDGNLAKVMVEFGGRALTFDQFCALK
jgi:predicted nucleic acid-binding protein